MARSVTTILYFSSLRLLSAAGTYITSAPTILTLPAYYPLWGCWPLLAQPRHLNLRLLRPSIIIHYIYFDLNGSRRMRPFASLVLLSICCCSGLPPLDTTLNSPLRVYFLSFVAVALASRRTAQFRTRHSEYYFIFHSLLLCHSAARHNLGLALASTFAIILQLPGLPPHNFKLALASIIILLSRGWCGPLPHNFEIALASICLVSIYYVAQSLRRSAQLRTRPSEQLFHYYCLWPWQLCHNHTALLPVAFPAIWRYSIFIRSHLLLGGMGAS